MKLAHRVQNLQASITVSIDTKAKEMMVQGVELISMGAGEPDFCTPEHIAQAGIDAIQSFKTFYSNPTGLNELKEAVCTKFSRDNALNYRPKQIVISSGAKHSVFNAIMALVNPGDEVIIPTPCWVTYPELVKLAGGTPVMLPTSADNNFALDPQVFRDAITERSKLIILNSPNNPTGAVYSKSLLKEIAEIVVENDLYCLSDEIYEHIVYDQKHYSIAAMGDEIKERSVVINGVSKAYAMTGWRIGYLAANADLAKAIGSLQSQSTHHPATISQWAALKALQAEQSSVQQMRQEFNQRRNYVYEFLKAIPQLKLPSMSGAFYAFPDVSHYYGKSTPEGKIIENSMDFCTWLLEKHKLVVIPGIAFGADKHLRFSFATSLAKIQQGLHKFSLALNELK